MISSFSSLLLFIMQFFLIFILVFCHTSKYTNGSNEHFIMINIILELLNVRGTRFYILHCRDHLKVFLGNLCKQIIIITIIIIHFI